MIAKKKIQKSGINKLIKKKLGVPEDDANKPFGHLAQEVELPILYVSVGQVTALRFEHAIPDGHGDGTAIPIVAHMKPTGQLAGADAPAVQNFPTGHCPDTAVRPEAEQKNPPVHCVGADNIPAEQYEPAGHTTEPATPPGQ
jgi:hypothetical protein